jgi:metallophosphoesterase superfamily enzyme
MTAASNPGLRSEQASVTVKPHTSALRLVFLADTHLGFDQPVRPKAKRRRRGPDFLANFRRVLADAIEQRVDLVVHGGDLFFRSKVPGAIVDLVYRELTEFAEHGIPLVVVPGNHERSRLPTSLFLRHPNIHVFDEPRTLRFDLGGARVALAGFANVRKNVRDDFPRLMSDTGWYEDESDVRLLCLHQTVEGATVGPAGYTFRRGHDVVRLRDLPVGFHAVLAGHIHRHQVLRVERGSGRPMPVIYPGSVERTSFAEADETKGYCRLGFDPSPDGDWNLTGMEFVPLPARPMETVALPEELAPSGVPEFLAAVAREAPPDAILRFTAGEAISSATRAAFGSGNLAEGLPPTVNVQFGSGFFGLRRSAAKGSAPRSDVRLRLAGEVRETVPAAPGVYAFMDGRGRLLYIGKSVNLRQRMSSYFGHEPLRAEPHLGRLVAAIRSFAWWQTPSELMALLFEDAMIKEFLPPGNTRQKEMLENRYLELTDDEFASCRIVEHAPDFGDREVFGPFKDVHFASTLRDIVHEALGVRTCREPKPVGRCLGFDIGRCSGPCREAIGRDEYRESVVRARSFLSGEGDVVLDSLTVARDRASAARRYEEAARLRDAIGTCRRFGAHERFARRFTSGGCTIHCEEGGADYRFERGALIEPAVVIASHGRSARPAPPDESVFEPSDAGRRAAAALRRSPAPDRRLLADRTRIVCNWTRGRDGCRVRFGETADRQLTSTEGGA